MMELEELLHDEPPAKRLARHGYNRLLLLADAVYAIAVTLAALEIRPQGAHGSVAELWRALSLPVLAYLLSFGVIAIYWAVHRDTYARLRRVDGALTLIALSHLFCIALLPAFTKLMYEDLTAASLSVYAIGVSACGLTQALSWAYVAARPGLLEAGYSPTYRAVRLGSSLLIPVYFLWVALAGARLGETALFGAFVVVALLIAVRLGVLRPRDPARAAA